MLVRICPIACNSQVTPVAAMLRQALSNTHNGTADPMPRPRMRVVFVARTLAEFNALGSDIINASRYAIRYPTSVRVRLCTYSRA